MMRLTRRSLPMVGVALVATLLLTPTAARADGGAYIELDHTYYLAGERAVAEAYVSIPKAQQGILDRGPFFIYLFPRSVFPSAKPTIPDGSIRVGTVDVEAEAHDTYELKLRFTVPDVPSGTHYLGMCNDPCTVAGFKEPLIGSMSVAATAREIRLLQESGRLHSKVFSLQRDLRRSEKKMEALAVQLETALGGNARASSETADLRDRLAAADALLASESTRPLIDPWGPVVVGASLLALAAALIVRRRRVRSLRADAAEPIVS